MTRVLLGRALVKQYGARRALDGVDLEVPEGGSVAVMGPSGSGKSTLLHVLAGLATPTSGEVILDGHRLSTLNDDARSEFRRARIGMVFQAFNLVSVLTAAENVALPAVISGLPPASYRPRVDELLKTVGLAEQSDQLPSELSGGQQQRVALARALIMRPDVLLADEPTGNLDTATGLEVMREIARAHREDGQTVVIVTHDATVAAFADSVVFLRDGRLVDRLVLEGEGGDRAQLVLAWLQERSAASSP